MIASEKSFDPRYGIQVPIAANTTMRTPGGLTSIQRQNRIVSVVVGQQPVEITDTVVVNGKTSVSKYNNNTKLQTTLSPEGRQTFTYYDAKGQVIKDSIPGIASTTYTYDSQGLLLTSKQAGRITRYSYNALGQLKAITDPLNRTDSLYYDDAGQIRRSVSSDGREVLYNYDQNGNLTSITPPGRTAHTFDYNANDAQKLYTPPALGEDSLTSTQYAYNANSQLTRTTFADGSYIDITYDQRDGMPQSVLFDRGQINLEYDSTSGVLQSLTSPEGNTLNYTYDGSLPLTESWTGEVNGTVGVKYDSDFKVTAQTVNGTDTVKFVYDKDGNLINAGQLKLKLNVQNGLLQNDTLGGTTTAYSYSTLGELTGYTAKYGASTLYQTAFTRDSLGRISTKSETVGGITKQYRYRYDMAGRLWEVYRNDTLTSRYEYDQNGNRVFALRNSIADSGRYDSQDRMTSYGGNDYVYTKSGYLKYKIAGSDTTAYAYDTYGNLISVKLPRQKDGGQADGTLIQYMTDGTNRRIGKKLNGNWVQKFIYSSDLAPAAELDSADNVVARFIYSKHQNVPEYIYKGGTTYKVITDQLGSVRLVIDNSTGSIVQQIDYDEFGQVIFDSNPGFQPFGFAGGLFDQQTKLVRFGARDYDAITGRWMSKDPIGFEGGDGTNLQAYVTNDPINNIDPNGEFAVNQFLINTAISAGIGAATNAAFDIGWQTIENGWTFEGYDKERILEAAVLGAILAPLTEFGLATKAASRVFNYLFGRPGGVLNTGKQMIRIGVGEGPPKSGNWAFRISGDLIKKLPKFLQSKGHIYIRQWPK